MERDTKLTKTQLVAVTKRAAGYDLSTDPRTGENLPAYGGTQEQKDLRAVRREARGRLFKVVDAERAARINNAATRIIREWKYNQYRSYEDMLADSLSRMEASSYPNYTCSVHLPGSADRHIAAPREIWARVADLITSEHIVFSEAYRTTGRTVNRRAVAELVEMIMAARTWRGSESPVTANWLSIHTEMPIAWMRKALNELNDSDSRVECVRESRAGRRATYRYYTAEQVAERQSKVDAQQAQYEQALTNAQALFGSDVYTSRSRSMNTVVSAADIAALLERLTQAGVDIDALAPTEDN